MKRNADEKQGDCDNDDAHNKIHVYGLPVGALLAPCYVKRDAHDQQDDTERNEGDERFQI